MTNGLEQWKVEPGSIHVGDYIKILRAAERFWCEVMGRDDEGATLRGDSPTIGVGVPRRGDVFHVGLDEFVFEHMVRSEYEALLERSGASVH